jgi:hypothetical protein
MYLAVPFKAVGLSFIDTIKVIFAISVLTSGLFTYLWLRKIFSVIPSFFGTLFFVYAPYHIYDLTRRGSAGELLSLAVAPFVLWQAERKSVLFTAIGIFLLILSHNSLSVLFLALILCYMFLSIYTNKKNKELLRIYLLSVIAGLASSAFFWIPALFELRYTVFNDTKISEFSNYFADINLIIPTALLLIVSSPFFIIRKNLFKEHPKLFLMFAFGLVSIFLSTFLSKYLWEILPVAFVQFPFRFLSLAIVVGGFLLAFCIANLPKKYRLVGGLVSIAVAAVFAKDYMYPVRFQNEPESLYATNEATTTVKDEYMPIWVLEKPTKHYEEKIAIISGEGNYSNLNFNSKFLSFDYVSSSPSIVQVSTIYYPGWTATSNGQEKAIFYDNKKGLIQLKLTEGNQKIRLEFSETPVRLFADLISVSGFLFIFLYTFRNRIIASLKLFKK